jgi:carboxy-cis,cis-muconate cyclase
MNKLSLVACLALAVGHSLADQHHLFTSSISTPHLFALEFDDQKNTLTNVANMTAHDGHPWISFSYDKSTLYAGERSGFASYQVLNNTALAYTNSINLPAACAEANADGIGSPYVLAELRTPFTVFGASSSSCGAVMSVDISGNLQNVLQSFKFRDGSSIKGMALDPDNRYLFSADELANGIWTHSVTTEGTVNPLTFVTAPGRNRGPRHLVVHPDGKYLYVVMGGSNTVAVFAINNGIGSNRDPLAYTGLSYSLLPRGKRLENFGTPLTSVGATNQLYKADEVLLSVDANVLYATTRYVEPPRVQPNPTQVSGDDDEEKISQTVTRSTKRASQPGYITAILLTPLGETENPTERRLVGSGFPIRPLFQLATTTSGGLSNSVSPAPWGNDYFALADSEVGLMEVR